jgi:outer membrane protein assembly factor BamB
MAAPHGRSLLARGFPVVAGWLIDYAYREVEQEPCGAGRMHTGPQTPPRDRPRAVGINLFVATEGRAEPAAIAAGGSPHGLGMGSIMLSVRWTPRYMLALALAVGAPGSVFGHFFAPPSDVDATDAQASFTPRDRRLQGHLDQAQRELADPQADHRAALESLQQLIDQAEDVFTDATMRQSVRDRALELIATLPEPTARLYEEGFGPSARALLDSDELDPQRTQREIVRRYFYTAAGAEAAWQLAASQMDRGNLLGAARLLERLHSRHPRADRFEPKLSLRQVVCYWRSGEADLAAEVLVRAAQGDPDLELLNQPLAPMASTGQARQWLAQHLGEVHPAETTGTPQWLLPRGSSTGNHSAAAVSPLYDDAWSVPLLGPRDADAAVLVEELAGLLDEVASAVHQAGDAAIPAVAPIVAGDLVVFASYGLVKAFEIDSGRLRWVALPADHTFADLLTTTTGAATRRLPDEMTDFLLQRGWLDRVSSQISSDGERVYALRDAGMIGGMTTPFNPISHLDHPRRSRPYNALRAYDAAGGSWLWELGGPRTRVAAALAGTYFLGPPLEVDGTLYVLGEDLGQVRLHAIEPATGEPLWSVPLANSDNDIEDDLDRRLAGLSPTLAGGLLICPTGSGLVVAVDPLTRALQWGTRYRDPQVGTGPRQFRRGPFIGFAGPQREHVSVEAMLSQPRWHDAGIVVSGSSVLVPTPDVADSGDSQRLICLDLLDGTLRWPPRDRGETLYVGGVFDELVLLVGARQVEGVSLADGRTVWTVPIDQPSGRGVRSGRLYHLPLTTGEIATLDISQGRLLARSSMRSGHPLGNLIAVDGQLVSLSAAEVRAFRPRGDVLEQIARDLEQQPDSPAALAARGELRLHAGELEDGLADLRRATAESGDPRARVLLVTTLLEGLRSDFAGWRSHVDELEELAGEPALRSRFLMTYADGLIAAGETTEGFRQYLRLLKLVGPEAPLDFAGEGRRVRRDRRILGQLAELYSASDQAGRDRLQEVIAAESPAAASEQQEDSLLARLGTAIPALRIETEGSDEPSPPDEDLLPTQQEARLLSLRQNSPDEQQATIAAWLVELYAKHGRAEPVLSLLDELESVWAEQLCLDELTGAEWAEQARSREPIAALLSAQPVWPTGEVHVREGQGQANPFAPMRREGPFDPLVSPFLFLPDSTNQLSIRDGYGRPISKLVLTTLSSSSQYVMQRGHRAVIFQGTQFKLIDLIDAAPRIVLEETVVDMEASDIRGLRMNQRSVLRQQGFRGTALMSPNPDENGTVGPLNDSIFCYVRGTTLYAHDPFTGEALWSVDNVPHGAEIFADEHFVLLVPLGQNVAHLYRALDGAKLGARTLPPDIVRERHGADWGRYFLRLSRGGDSHRLAMYDPVTQEDLWQREVPASFLWTPRDGYELCVVDPTKGQLALLNPLSGEPRHQLEVDLPDQIRSIGILNLPDQWLLTTYRRPPADAVEQLAVTHGSAATIAVNGPVTAFRQHTAEPMWSRIITSQTLTPDMPSRWPVLPLSATLSQARQAGGRMNQVLSRRVLLIDRRTGETLHTAETVATGSIRSLDSFWQIEQTPPQLRLQYGLLQLEVSFGEPPAEGATPEEPAAEQPPAFPPAPPRPVKAGPTGGTPAPAPDERPLGEFRREDAPVPPPDSEPK